jgi:hypothetical protein
MLADCLLSLSELKYPSSYWVNLSQQGTKAKKTLVGDGIDIWFANADDE